MGVDFDVWFSERTLHARRDDGSTEIEDAIARLTERGHLFEHEGALWFRSSAFGDDKDRVLRKSDGEYTYFAADIAYHWDKLDVRGFDRVIDIWGADHHGYVARMKAAVAALGHEGQLDVVIGQLVNLFRNGEAVRMSKRTGEMVTFEELLDEVGPDAARYWFLRRSTDQQVDFDIEVARQNTADNPVYYVQYAHARICSILRKAAAAQGLDAEKPVDELAEALVSAGTDLSVLTADEELALMRRLSEFSEVVEAAARDLAPHRLARYAEELAATFHQFYTQCRVFDPEAPGLTAARLYAVDATRRALRCVLGLLGVSAPERM
jgi:arginyl-tRNA synthetase